MMQMKKQLQILIADPREALRKGLCAIFAEESAGMHIYEAATSEELTSHLERHSFDLVVVHQSMVTDISILPQGDFVLLATEPDMDTLQAARLHGARAYLLDNASGDMLRQALHPAKRMFLTDPSISAWILEYLAHHMLLSINDEILTAREREVFRLLWSGLSKREVARQLFLTESTVRAHTAHIYEKFGLNRYQMKILGLLRSQSMKEC